MTVAGLAGRRWNPWANDAATLDLYRRRCRKEAEEMTCARQAAEVLGPLVGSGESLLDAGCGGGYYLWSFLDRGVELDWHGLDYTPEMIELARSELCPRAGVAPERFELGAIEGIEGRFDNVLCFNVLTNSPHYALPLERLLEAAGKRILLRESLGTELTVRYTPDPYLDEGARHIRVYHNTYPRREVVSFMEEHGFAVTAVPDERTGDGTELVVDIPHEWRILLGERREPASGA
ncbi:MAG TPA: class I SAM-dependent methyltransferase [Thermoleophilaceae bacterium]|nr:class I SAM-dependent methyltransferase [Thermoleophilaceae bacterium]